MKLIRINDNSKGGLCCSASIDLSIGCKNNCVGCYAAKASRMGKSFFLDDPIYKEYDDTKFHNDCKKYSRKGIKFIRLGKFSDAGDPAVTGALLKVLQASTSEGLRIVFVTKSLKFDSEIAKELIKGNHILHVSLGMITDNAPTNLNRIIDAASYKTVGVNVKFRIVDDITKEMSPGWNFGPENVIVTPMRFSSKNDLNMYGADISNYKFISGYYRPIKPHKSWNDYLVTCCGEIGEVTYCCECGVKND